MIPLKQDAFCLDDITLPDFFNFNFELMIESSNFPFIPHPISHGDRIWRSILGLTNGVPGPGGGRHPAFFLHYTEALFMSIFAIPAKKERWTKIVLDQWLSFIFFCEYRHYLSCAIKE